MREMDSPTTTTTTVAEVVAEVVGEVVTEVVTEMVKEVCDSSSEAEFCVTASVVQRLEDMYSELVATVSAVSDDEGDADDDLSTKELALAWLERKKANLLRRLYQTPFKTNAIRSAAHRYSMYPDLDMSLLGRLVVLVRNCDGLLRTVRQSSGGGGRGL
jgi:hypothetical protein